MREAEAVRAAVLREIERRQIAYAAMGHASVAFAMAALGIWLGGEPFALPQPTRMRRGRK